MIEQLLGNLNTNLARMASDNQKVSTGKRVHRPSDDPLLTSRILKFRTDLRALEQHRSNNDDAKSWLDASETTIGHVNKAMARVRELTVQAANGVNTADDRKKILSEITQIKEDVIANANFSFSGKYIFSGFHTDQKLLKKDGSFNIDITDFETSQNPVSRFQIGVGEDINVMTSGVDVFGAVIERDELFATFNRADKLYPNAVGVSPVKESVSYAVDLANLPTEQFEGKTVSFDGNTFAIPTAPPVTYATGADLATGLAAATYTDALTGAVVSLSDVANVSFDAVTSSLSITSKKYGDLMGEIDISSTSLGSRSFTSGVDAKGYTGSNVFNEGTKAVRESVSYDFDESALIHDDFNTVQITVNGTAYTITAAAPYRTATDLIEGINSATDGTASLSSVADVYFDTNNKLIIKSKTYGAGGGISMAGGTVTSLGGAVPTPGTSTTEASVTSATAITDFDASPFAGKSYVVNINGEVKKITLADTPITNAAQLQTAFQNAMNTAFPGKVNVSEAVGVFTFETTGTPPGTQPYLEIKAVVSDKPNIIDNLEYFINALNSNSQPRIDDYLGKIDKDFERIYHVLSDIGGRYNRVELVDNRISENDLTFSKLLSDAQDADIAEVYMKLKSSEAVYNASLSAGAKVIQPSLVDFLR